jgi:hypothetical protein
LIGSLAEKQRFTSKLPGNFIADQVHQRIDPGLIDLQHPRGRLLRLAGQVRVPLRRDVGGRDDGAWGALAGLASAGAAELAGSGEESSFPWRSGRRRPRERRAGSSRPTTDNTLSTMAVTLTRRAAL